MPRLLYLLVIIILTISTQLSAQQQTVSLDAVDIQELADIFFAYKPSYLTISGKGVAKQGWQGDTIVVTLSTQASYMPYRSDMVAGMYADMRRLYQHRGISATHLRILCDNRPIEDLVPKAMGGTVQRPLWSQHYAHKRERKPLVTPLDASARETTAALQGRHIALWASHGYIYDNRKGAWRWQRPVLNGTVEDLLSRSFVLTYLAPMLERSGAIVMMPHERDLSTQEYIIDNDEGATIQSGTFTTVGDGWTSLDRGFAYTKKILEIGENPFEHGTALGINSETQGLQRATWTASIQQPGIHAVYVSYRSLPLSTESAQYTVHYAGGEAHFSVNQTMGGGTWVYLGTFPFDTTGKQGVSLSNKGADGQVITADAVKIGGGMGNIARSMPAVVKRVRRRKVTIPATPLIVSTMPRYAEGAKYWMQWAGMPESVYNGFKGKDDYTDDFKSRGVWVSYLAGGAPVNPNEPGLNIPIDLALAFHTDAGKRNDDKVVGTLGIYNSKWDNGVYAAGHSRSIARELTDLVQSSVVNDLRALQHSDWVRRGMWDRNYAEATWGCVPTMLLELLSHQNFTDMRFGHDPNYKFVVARAIYKGVLRYLATEYNLPYIVHPLPVQALAAEPDFDQPLVHLSWRAQYDPLEPSAAPSHYLVYVGEKGNPYRKPIKVKGTSLNLKVNTGKVYNFYIEACNAGGRSFSSEVISAVVSDRSDARRVLVLNGFDRVAGVDCDPQYGYFKTPDTAMPLGQNILVSEDSKPLVMHGNTFDYMQHHARAWLQAGCSVGSISRAFVAKMPDMLKGYDLVDLQLGRQRLNSCVVGDKAPRYQLFDADLSFALESYLNDGGHLVASGAHLSSGLLDEGALSFARDVLGYMPSQSIRSYTGRVHGSENGTGLTPIVIQRNSVETIEPTPNSSVLLRHSETSEVMGIYTREPYAVVMLAIPLENLLERDADNWVLHLLSLFDF